MTAPASGGRQSFPIGRLLLAVALVVLAIKLVDVLLVVFLAVILAIYLDALTDLLERRAGMPRPIGLALGVAVTLGALVGTVLLIAPPVTEQVQDLLTNLPQYLTSLDANINALHSRHSDPPPRRHAGRGGRARPPGLGPQRDPGVPPGRGGAVPQGRRRGADRRASACW